MDAKVHLVRPVHHRDAGEMIGLAHPALRLTRAVESVGLGADLGVAARHRRYSFLESYPEPVRDFHPSASADVAQVDSQRRLAHSAKLPLVASAGLELVAQAVVVAKVVGHPAKVLQVVALRPEAQLGAAMARQAEVIPGEGPQASSPLGQRELQQAELLVSEPRARAQRQKVEQPELLRQAQLERTPAAALVLEQQRAALAQPGPPVSGPLPQAAAQQVWMEQETRALARPVWPGAIEPLSPLLLSPPCQPPPSLRPQPLHPRRRGGACGPSRPRPPESSWSASSFLLRRTRATGR